MGNIFSKTTWIVVILVVIVAGVVLVWLTTMIPGEKEGKGFLEEKKLTTIPAEYLPLLYGVFSPNGDKIAYAIKEEGGEQVIVNDQKDKIYDKVWEPIFSPDGKQIAYKAQKGEKYLVIINSEESELYDYVEEPVFSPDSKQVGYLAGIVNNKDQKEEYFIVVNDRRINPPTSIFQTLITGGPIFTPDNKIAYKLFKKGKEHWIVGGEELKGWGWLGGIIFSPDGKRFAYLTQEGPGGKNLWVIDGKEGKTFDQTTGVEFSADSSKAYYAAKRDGKWFIVLNGKEQKTYNEVSEPVFSPDGKLVYVAIKSTEKEQHPYEYFVVINGQEGKSYDGISPTSEFYFSPDGRYVGYGANIFSKKGVEVWWIVDKIK